jgi:hypothetical protein
MRTSSLIFGFTLTTISSFCQAPYSLFNPVPKSDMRIFSIDRPDVTESPMTVDAGHFQFEGDLYKWRKIYQTNAPRTVNVMNGLYKLGLTPRWDIHLGIELYNIYQNSEGRTLEKGYGNTMIRLKYNFWGNDGETRSALGMIPYVILPTSKLDDDASFGVGFPFSYELGEQMSAGGQFQFDFLPDGQGSYDFNYLQTIVIGGAVVGPFDYFLEGVAIFSEGPSIFSLNGGILYNISPNVKIDVATNLGLVEEAASNVFLGLSFRL